MPVGNDVVDLRDPESRARSLHPRFDARVFTPGERAVLEESVAQERLRWCLWAAKESAYKVARKLDPGVRFLPRRFGVRLLDGMRAEVRHRAGRFQVWLEEARDWIHAVAIPEGDECEPPSFRLERFRGDAGSGPALGRSDGTGAHPSGRGSGGELASGGASARVRALALEALIPLLPAGDGVPRIVSRAGIPEIWLGGRRPPFDLSLSHHGEVVACAWSRELPAGGSRPSTR